MNLPIFSLSHGPSLFEQCNNEYVLCVICKFHDDFIICVSGESTEPTNILRITNLPYKTEAEDIENLFKKTVSIKIPKYMTYGKNVRLVWTITDI